MHRKRHTRPYTRPYPGCPRRVPGNGFAQERDLERQRETHRVRASYPCLVEACLSTATRPYSMVRHMRDQHGMVVKQAGILRRGTRMRNSSS
ncbi:hypothetical protein L209DRAFT_275908 [Thermothelomyces heterothallicus CBS 203.75]